MSTDIVLCGVGGQGTVLASKLISGAAMSAGIAVKAAETIGMAQRGGSVMSNVRIGENTHSPLIGNGSADLLISFEPAEAVRRLPLLGKDGTVIVADRPVVPVSAMTGGPAYDLDAIMAYLRKRVSADRLVVVDASAAERETGSAKFLNVVLLGVAARTGALGLSADVLKDQIRDRVSERFVEADLKAFSYGFERA